MDKKDLVTTIRAWNKSKIRPGSLVTGKDPKTHEMFHGLVQEVHTLKIVCWGVLFNPDGTFKKEVEWIVSSIDKEELNLLKY